MNVFDFCCLEAICALQPRDERRIIFMAPAAFAFHNLWLLE
jgi:hypothetical protein